MEYLFRRVCAPDIIVGQEKQAHAGTVQGRAGTKSGFLQSRWFRNGIRVERGRFECLVTWPEPTTDHFMRIGFACDPVCPCAFGGAPSRKTCHRQVETPPEQMNRAALANKM